MFGDSNGQIKLRAKQKIQVSFCYRLSPATVHSAVSRFDSGGKWWIHVSSIVTYLRKNSSLLPWNSCKQRSESSMHCCFLLTVSNSSTNFEYSFLIDKMLNTLPSNILTPLPSHATTVYDRPKRVCEVFWCFPGQLPNLGNLSVQHHLYQYDRVSSQHTTA